MNIALILSGGTGTRMGTHIPKQYIEVCGKPIISYCIECILKHPEIDAIQIAAEEEWRALISDSIEQLSQTKETGISGKFKGFSKPGATRQLSILNGLEDIKEYALDSDYVLIHDAARPMLSAQMISDCLDAVKGHDGVIPVLPMKDTVYSSKDGKTIISLLRRKEIYAGQAPEAFCLGKYYEANRKLLPDEILRINGSTEPAVMAGMDIVMINGDESNFKITTRADLDRFEQIIREKGTMNGIQW